MTHSGGAGGCVWICEGGGGGGGGWGGGDVGVEVLVCCLLK